ncbi:2-dehydro-3-deoxygalactonokinase [Citreimonas salinaria]|uniref:2-keto-3-deoxygalactonate kinase n=1 Tax=Citreimonas salinaria TaxID=321339 RepID=A0A1H3H7L7_9RHOB|nr:2-dehydro-3-deoxygalactonokinase [Citreimonas salinaria]SDY10898.1 2-keto-3-deoxygalactonate kinase [Citreimonas salinaria]
MHEPMQRPDWIALDWGAARLRAWLMRADGSVIDTRLARAGADEPGAVGVEPALLALVADALGDDGGSGQPVPVLCCGLAGARQAVPFVAVPAPPPSSQAAVRIETRDPRLDLRALPGMKQDSPADVMQGEGTIVAGALAVQPGFDGVFCLPGEQTRWVHVSAGEIVSFRTFMTGELFALLSRHSVLRHHVGDGTGWDGAAFDAGVGDAMARPQRIGAALFGIRAAGLLQGLSSGAARARLSGLLIGLELAGSRPHWLGQDIRVLGTGGLARAYRAALSAQAASVQTMDADDLTLRGLRAAYEGTTG